jgi:hypothetical protein
MPLKTRGREDGVAVSDILFSIPESGRDASPKFDQKGQSEAGFIVLGQT